MMPKFKFVEISKGKQRLAFLRVPEKKITLQEFKVANGWNSYGFENNEFPCITCRGNGWQYDPDEEIDAVEGYKMITKLTCPTCHRIRTMPKVAFLPYFEAYNQKLEKEYNDWLAEIEEFKNIAAKLTEKEFKTMLKIFNKYEGGFWMDDKDCVIKKIKIGGVK